MIKKKSVDNQLDDEIYEKFNPLNWKFFVLGFSLLVIGFLVNFPIRKTLVSFISNKMQSNRNCPIVFERLDIGRFLQSFNFVGPIVSGKCFGQSARTLLRFDSMSAALKIPSLNPPGLKLQINLNQNKTKINLSPVISYPNSALMIENSIFDAEIVEKITGGLFKLLGQVKINSNLKLQKDNLGAGTIEITSKNLAIPPQNIMNFLVPYLNIETLKIKGMVKGINNLSFQAINLGSAKSPIIANFSGSIKLNKNVIRSSILDLKGKVKFSNEFIKKFPVLNLFTAGKSPGPDGFYPISISGPMGRPKTKLGK